MEQFRDKVAVITGAGRGIGRAIAVRCAHEGMKVVLAGIGPESLARTAADLREQGATVLCVQTDVTKVADVKRLAAKTLDAFGAVHLLVNNAGVGAGATVWESTLADWEWTLGVNLWGVVYGVKVFTPIMIAQDTACHIVNVSSVAGLLAGPGLGIYKVAKHGVVSLSETLYYELAQRGTQVGVSVLCPGFVNTDIMTGERNRPAALQNDPSEVIMAPEVVAGYLELQEAIASGIAAEQVADALFAGIAAGQLYILTHPEMNGAITARAEDIVLQRSPALA